MMTTSQLRNAAWDARKMNQFDDAADLYERAALADLPRHRQWHHRRLAHSRGCNGAGAGLGAAGHNRGGLLQAAAQGSKDLELRYASHRFIYLPCCLLR
jgi:hypothetical protein